MKPKLLIWHLLHILCSAIAITYKYSRAFQCIFSVITLDMTCSRYKVLQFIRADKQFIKYQFITNKKGTKRFDIKPPANII